MYVLYILIAPGYSQQCTPRIYDQLTDIRVNLVAKSHVSFTSGSTSSRRDTSSSIPLLDLHVRKTCKCSKDMIFGRMQKVACFGIHIDTSTFA